MRSEMQLIIPQLYLGPYKAATKSQEENLTSCRITHIVCIRDPQHRKFIHVNFPDKINYKVLEFSDSSVVNIIQYIKPFATFVNEGMKHGGNILVHGLNGMSRSAALVVAYVMETRRISLRESLEIVSMERRCISINKGFFQQLKDYEAIYMAKFQTNMMEVGMKPHGVKRKSDELE